MIEFVLDFNDTKSPSVSSIKFSAPPAFMFKLPEIPDKLRKRIPEISLLLSRINTLLAVPDPIIASSRTLISLEVIIEVSSLNLVSASKCPSISRSPWITNLSPSN